MKRTAEEGGVMTTIKPTRVDAAEVQPSSRPARAQPQTTEPARSKAAIDLKGVDAELRGLLEGMRDQIETEHAARLEKIREAVKSGEYVPNLKTVAERMLTDI